MPDPMNDIRVVEAGRGASWWAQGWRTFRSNLWTWIGIMLIFIIISMLISLLPFVGDAGHSLLAPVFIGGLMLGCRAIARGEPLRVAHLFEGFQGVHFVPLLIIGAIDFALTLLITVIVAGGAFGGGSLLDTMRSGGADPMAAMSRSATAIGLTGFFAMIAGLAIAAIMGTLNWFAPALVVLHGAKSIDAMKTSFIACWRNWAPFLIYGLVSLALAVALLAVYGGLAATFVLGGAGSDGNWIVALIGLVVFLLIFIAVVALALGPVFFGSTYASYGDVFGDADENDTGNPAYR
jgi:hypothetical protein